MEFLFVDNVRGFSDTFIPIKDVNFFVGENSTGKTSIIDLITFLFSSNWWSEHKLDARILGPGHFMDIVSADSQIKSRFNIGLVLTDYVGDKEETSAFLFSFSNRKGVPWLHKYYSCWGGLEVKLVFTQKTVRYTTISHESAGFSTESARALLSHWRESTSQPPKGYKVLRTPYENRIPVVLAESLARNELGNKQNHIFGFPFFRPGFQDSYVPLAPIRSKPRNTYDKYSMEYSPEGEHTPYLIKRMFDSKEKALAFKAGLMAFGKASSLFENIRIKEYGKGGLTPFTINVVLNHKPLKIGNVGYGVSQVLPVIVELLTRPKNTLFSIQQPEVHLHPRAQAAIGDLLYELAARDKKRFIIETHSDFTIDRFLSKFRKGKKDRLTSQIIFFERTTKGNRAYPMDIDQQGKLPDDQPAAYRKFFIKEKLSLLGL